MHRRIGRRRRDCSPGRAWRTCRCQAQPCRRGRAQPPRSAPFFFLHLAQQQSAAFVHRAPGSLQAAPPRPGRGRAGRRPARPAAPPAPPGGGRPARSRSRRSVPRPTWPLLPMLRDLTARDRYATAGAAGMARRPGCPRSTALGSGSGPFLVRRAKRLGRPGQLLPAPSRPPGDAARRGRPVPSRGGKGRRDSHSPRGRLRLRPGPFAFSRPTCPALRRAPILVARSQESSSTRSPRSGPQVKRGAALVGAMGPRDRRNGLTTPSWFAGTIDG